MIFRPSKLKERIICFHREITIDQIPWWSQIKLREESKREREIAAVEMIRMLFLPIQPPSSQKCASIRSLTFERYIPPLLAGG
jgi:hypothetical protein